MIEILWKNTEQQNAVNYFCKKCLLRMFVRVVLTRQKSADSMSKLRYAGFSEVFITFLETLLLKICSLELWEIFI